MDIDITLFSANTNKMIKYNINTGLPDGTPYGQTAFGTQELPGDGSEVCFHNWCGMKHAKANIYVMNRGIYGGSFENGAIKISLLRTPVYAAHPILEREIAPHNRYLSHIDMGERHFALRISPEQKIDAAAQVYNEQPQLLSFFPQGEGAPAATSIICSNKDVLVTSYKQTQKGFIVHMFNTTDAVQESEIRIPRLGVKKSLNFKAFEIKLLKVDNGDLCESV